MERVEGSVSEGEQTNLDAKMGDGVWVVSQRRNISHVPTRALTVGPDIRSGGRWFSWPLVLELNSGSRLGLGPWQAHGGGESQEEH